MKKILLPLVLITLGSTSQTAMAGSWSTWFTSPICVPNCACAKCCDDFCSKPCPKFKGVCDFKCDDYCHKSIPCARTICGEQCDDYQRKCLPSVNCRTASPYRCPPPAGGKSRHVIRP